MVIVIRTIKCTVKIKISFPEEQVKQKYKDKQTYIRIRFPTYLAEHTQNLSLTLSLCFSGTQNQAKVTMYRGSRCLGADAFCDVFQDGTGIVWDRHVQGLMCPVLFFLRRSRDSLRPTCLGAEVSSARNGLRTKCLVISFMIRYPLLIWRLPQQCF